MDNFDIDIQVESTHAPIPNEEELVQWATAALESAAAEITIRIVDEAESKNLNKTYRQKDNPTNVLAFPFNSLSKNDMLHGDIVICAPIVSKEAKDQNKSIKDHWAHLTVHGILHLQGYDHIKAEDAEIMEQKEIAILSSLGISNPYE